MFFLAVSYFGVVVNYICLKLLRWGLLKNQSIIVFKSVVYNKKDGHIKNEIENKRLYLNSTENQIKQTEWKPSI